MSLQSLLRALSLLCLTALVALSWLPKSIEAQAQVLGVPGQVEHVIAYLGTAGTLRVGWPAYKAGRLFCGLVALAGVLEVGQLWVPGRTSQAIDFAASSMGAFVGLWAAHIFLTLTCRTYRPSQPDRPLAPQCLKTGSKLLRD